MLETLARIDVDKAGFICFVTLTYPDRDGPPNAVRSTRDLQTFLKRFKRAHPESSALWRREWEARKTGSFAGLAFPHYHLLFFGLPFVHYKVLRQIWGEVIDHEGNLRTEIKGIENWQHAFYYVSKYMAKLPEDAECSPPTPAGAGEAPAGEGPPATAGVGGEAACSLVYVSYLTGAKETKVGRSWGVFNREKCPFDKAKSIELPRGDWLKEAKDLARKVWPGVNDDPTCGFTLFVENAAEWILKLGELGETNPNQFNQDGEYDPIPF